MFKKKYWSVLGIYLLMQILSVVIPFAIGILLGYDLEQLTMTAIYTNIVLFIIALVAIIWIMWKDIREEKLANPLGAGMMIGWIALGLLLAWIAQVVAASILMYGFGIDEGSANTEQIVEISRLNPIFIIIPAIVGPIMEELIFRKVIFGYLNDKFNFWFAAIASSIIFGLAHMEPQLLLIYAVMGFVFAYIYHKTKRVIVPMLVHILLNSVAVIGQLVIDPEKLQQMQDEVMMIFNFY